MELLERFAGGDPEAFETLFREYQGAVFGWILRIVRDRATAEDLTVETFWRMYRARARFDAKTGNCAGWLRRIATNVAIDSLRCARPEVSAAEDPRRAATSRADDAAVYCRGAECERRCAATADRQR